MQWSVILSVTVAEEEGEDGESGKGPGRLDTCKKGARKQEGTTTILREVFVT